LRTRPDVVSVGAVVTLPAVDTWFDPANSPIVLIVALGIIAVVALMVAAAAYSGDARRRSRQGDDDDSEIFTTTPLPMPTEELARMRQEARQRRHALAPRRLPPWVQLGSVAVALGITFIAAQRLRTDEPAKDGQPVVTDAGRSVDRADADDGSPASLDLAPTSGPPFQFRSRDFIAAATGCTGRLEVSKGAPGAWNLTARAHDERGQLIDSAFARVGNLREGEVVEFRFPRASCERIGAWDVSGARRDP
jgi:hypothetical protein